MGQGAALWQYVANGRLDRETAPSPAVTVGDGQEVV